jgi:RNA polymerase sigma factor (sigma-70 family)
MAASGRAFTQVVSGLKKGIAPTGKRLGGNVLEEGVLLTLASRQNRVACKKLAEGYLLPVAKHVWRERSVDIDSAEELENVLYLKLLGEGKQREFRGLSGLRRWLSVVARREVVDSLRKQKNKCPVLREPAVENMEASEIAIEREMKAEITQKFENWLQAALKTPDGFIKVVVIRLWQYDVPNRKIAALIKLSAGQTTRIRKRALSEIRNTPKDA